MYIHPLILSLARELFSRNIIGGGKVIEVGAVFVQNTEGSPMQSEERMAVEKKKDAWGLVLIGGGARGFAHIGLLEVLETDGIVPDVVTGTSMGAIVGGLYAAGIPTRELRRLAAELSLEKFVPLKILAVIRRMNNPLLNYFIFDFYIERTLGSKVKTDGDKVEAYLRSLVGDVLIEELPMKFGCNAVDLLSGREHSFKTGPLFKAIRASMAYPMAIDPARESDRLFIDGGVVNNAPVRLARELGAARVMVSDIDKPVNPVTEEHLKRSFDLLERAFDIAMASSTEERVREADYILRIPLDVDVLDFSRNSYIVRKGKREGLKNLETIRRFSRTG
jgi:NTE family protein